MSTFSYVLLIQAIYIGDFFGKFWDNLDHDY